MSFSHIQAVVAAVPKNLERFSTTATANAVQAHADLKPWVAELRASGLSLRQIAGRLDAEGHTTRLGKAWNPVQVGRILA